MGNVHCLKKPCGTDRLYPMAPISKILTYCIYKAPKIAGLYSENGSKYWDILVLGEVTETQNKVLILALINCVI